MNRKRKTEIDFVGRRLFEQSGLEPETVESIAASPNAYNSVLVRINEERSKNFKRSLYVSRVNRFGARRFAVAAMTLIVVSFVSFSLVYRDGDDAIDRKINFPVQRPEPARPINPPEVIENEQPIGRAKYSDASVEKAAARKRVTRREPIAGNPEPRAEFVSLGLPGSPQHTADGGRVIRVELPAASLFAMGVNVPLENDSAYIKADLIVGPDGVTRAVKIVE